MREPSVSVKVMKYNDAISIDGYLEELPQNKQGIFLWRGI
jgi:hypothetical protein